MSNAEAATNAGRSLAGCVYQLVQNVGSDGANVLKLIPVSKSSRSQPPSGQNSVFSDASKVNTANPVHVFQAQLPSHITAPAIQVPVYQQANTKNYILTSQVNADASGGKRSSSSSVQNTANSIQVFQAQLPSHTAAPAIQVPVYQQANTKNYILTSQINADTTPVATVENRSPSFSSVQNTSVPSLQKLSAPASSKQNDKAYMLINTKNLPLNVKSPVLPSGHHLQIPAHAEVKSVSASCLPPAIQQKILTSSVSDSSGAQEVTNIPTVIYVSPVNTVRTVVSQRLKTICPKPEMVMTNSQTINVVASENEQSQESPMKWVVQENPQSSSSPCLVPVKSSNNTASKILKSLADMRNVEYNSANILPLCSSSGATINKITPIKDNALVMCNGKVYLLAKKGSDILAGETEKQSYQSGQTTNETLARKAPEVPSSDSVTKLTSEVVNIVLSKNKSGNVNGSPNTDLNTKTAFYPVSSVKLEADGTERAHQYTSDISHLELLSTRQDALRVKILTERNDQLQEENCAVGSRESNSFNNGLAEARSQFKHGSMYVKEEEIPTEIANPWEEDSLILRKRKDSLLKKRFGIFKEVKVGLKRLPVPILSATSSTKTSPRSTDSDADTDFEMNVTRPGEEYWKEDVVASTSEQAIPQKRKYQILSNEESVKKKKSEKESTSTILSGLKNACNNLQSFNRRPPPISHMLQDSLDCSDSSLPNPKKEHAPQGESLMVPSVRDSGSCALVSAEEAFPQPPAVTPFSAQNLLPPPTLDPNESFRDEKIRRLKELLREREEALEAIRRKMRK